MTVKEALPLLDGADEVSLSFDGNMVSFNFRSKIEVEAWGNFVISGICAVKAGVFELVLAAQPIKKEEQI